MPKSETVSIFTRSPDLMVSTGFGLGGVVAEHDGIERGAEMVIEISRARAGGRRATKPGADGRRVNSHGEKLLAPPA